MRSFRGFYSMPSTPEAKCKANLYIALDQGYCDQVKFDELYEQARLAQSKIGAFIKYLNE